MAIEHQQVSFDDEPLILVDSQNQVLGHDTKLNAHLGEGKLHRAFSIFLFTDDDQVLLQQRAGEKPLWPLYWSNSCCSHPRRGEDDEAAVHRRLHEELGLDTDLHYLYRFEYQARFGDVGSEHELCSVYVGKLPTPITIDVNPSEIAAWRWVPSAEVDALVAAVDSDPDARITPWFVMEWRRLREDFTDTIAELPPAPRFPTRLSPPEPP